jgi:hypothetical protein
MLKFSETKAMNTLIDNIEKNFAENSIKVNSFSIKTESSDKSSDYRIILESITTI